MLVRRRSVVVTTVLCGVLAVGGCSTTESGNAQPSTTTDVAATAALWDPCSEIPDSTLTSLGLDATSERSGILGADEPGWKVCRWEDDAYPSNYSVGAYATIHTIDDLRAKTENIEFKDIVVAGRSGVQFRQSNYDANEDCSYAFPTSSGFVQLDMLNAGVSAKLVPPCERLQPIAETIVPLFPK